MKNKQITIIDVAKAAGVSIATVSNVLNRRKVPLTEETIRKVEEAATRLGYRRNVMAASLSRRKTFELGLLLPGFGGYFGDFAHVMQDTVHAAGYHLSVYSSTSRPELEQRHLETLLQRRVDGLFCHGLAMSPELTRTIVGEGTPLVLFNAWGWPQDVALGAVNLDFAGGSAAMVRHLAERGCRSIYYLSRNRARATDEQRRIGFSQGIEEVQRGGALLGHAIISIEEMTEDAVIETVSWHTAPGQPAGILCFDDYEAFVWINRLRERGRRVPEEFKVGGINNQAIAKYHSPSITSLSIDLEAQVQHAVRLLFRYLGDDARGSLPELPDLSIPSDSGVHEIQIPMQLVERQSTR
ncbi:LacI family DNA-binding transcriptional regulator [Gorillibacterium sp. sgz5001074]|uniref:LacI family DNA-binding transcriptional regulator n=1 Tax=Gorillibacterium sp. sgz5001074 TaxID=3446695 RepID=UPI003F676795